MRILVAAMALLACACGPVEPTREPAPNVLASLPNSDPAPVATPASTPAKAKIDRVDYFPPAPHRILDDMVRGCQGMNPVQRPRGSNCFAIFPEQCGADKAQSHIGEAMTPALQARLTSYSPGGDVRINRPGEAMIEDLRIGRLNVALDQRDIIQSVDCF